MEEASKAKKAKKGFMTPDRKKKLRVRILKKNLGAEFLMRTCSDLRIVVFISLSLHPVMGVEQLFYSHTKPSEKLNNQLFRRT